MTHAEPAPAPAPEPAPAGGLSTTEMGLAATGFLLQILALIPGYNEDGDFDPGGWSFCVGVAAVTTVLVFALAVRRAGAGWALGLAVCALLADLAFWSGLPMPLAAGAIALGLKSRARGDRPGMATAALIVAVVAVAAFVAIVISDAAAN